MEVDAILAITVGVLSLSVCLSLSLSLSLALFVLTAFSMVSRCLLKQKMMEVVVTTGLLEL